MVLLETENLVGEFGDLVTTDDASLTVEEDEHVFIIGPNDAGKSTLINLIVRRLNPTSGDIHFKGEPIVGPEPYQVVQRGVSRSFQTASVFPGLTTKESTEIAALTAERSTFGSESLRYHNGLTDVHGITHGTLNLVGLLDRTSTIATNLPYGGKHRLEVGIALVSKSDLLLMDEPAVGMSSEETRSAADLIEQVKCDHGLTFVLAEHDVEIVSSISDRIVVLGCGDIIAKGTPDEIRGNEAVQGAYLGGVEL